MKTSTFADLAATLHGMRASEPPTAELKSKRPKQKRKAPTDTRWQPLAEMDHPLPNKLQVHLRLGKHPKTRAPQWFGFYEHGRDRLKVVCDPHYRHELPVGGEIWEVRVTKQIPGIVFAVAETSASLVAVKEAERVKREEDRALWLTSVGEFVVVDVSVPQDPYLDNVDGAITGYGYHGKLESIKDEGEVWIFNLSNVSRSSRGWDLDGSFETDSRPYAGRHSFTLRGVEVTSETLHGYKEHQFGQSQISVYR